MRSALLVLLFAPLAAAWACNRQPTEVRTWRPSDHDHTENPTPTQVDMSDGGSQGVMGVSEVGLAAWKANCIVCHGLIGRGDGPKGPSVKARDLTDPAWQASVSDEQIADSIVHGKGKMPKADLPDETVQNLVRLVRLLDAARTRSADASADVVASDGGRQDAAPRRGHDAGAHGGTRAAALDAGAP